MTPEATLAAISSPPGAGARGILRISGPDAARIVRACVRADVDGPLPPPRRAAVPARLDDGRGTQPCLLLWFPGPRSFTREDVAELHLPGAPALLAAALARVLALGARPAAPGEFTRRAYLAGRIDLAQAEGVLELVAASGEAERRAALALLEGGLSARVEGLRARLADLRALCEASLDFDEAETGGVPRAELLRLADEALAELAGALAWEVRRQSPSALPRIALAGAPNAGKSSLFNALVPGGRAIVADHAGTTRDGVAGTWRVGEVECLLLDAPGVEEGRTEADRRAQAIAARERAAADLLLHVVDATVGEASPLALRALPARAERLLVWTKTDAAGARPAPPGAVAVSARTRAGLDALARAVAARLGSAAEGTGGAVRELSARHRAALEAAHAELAAARAGLAASLALDVAAEGLRRATDALDGITGRTSAEDVLDRIFARFCLGK